MGRRCGRPFPKRPERRCTLRTRSAFYPSDQANFPVSVGVAALQRKPLLGLYMSRIHTPKDTVLQEENLTFFAEGAKKLVSIL